VRAISAPPSRPEQTMRTPPAPDRMVDAIAFFIARLRTILTEHRTGIRKLAGHGEAKA